MIAASDAERANGKFLFLTDPQGFAAGHQQGQSWTSSNQLIEVDGGVDHLLEVIEQDETVLLAEVASKGLPDTRFALHNDSGCLGDRLRDQRRLAHGSERDESNAVFERMVHFGSGSDGKASFSDASRPGERDQRKIWLGKQPSEGRKLPFPADERRTVDG